MARSEFRFSHDEIKIGNQRQQVAIDLLIREAMRDIMEYAESRAIAYAPERTGNLRRNIRSTNPRKVGGNYVATLGVGRGAPYGRFVEKGTGIFGVFRRPIVPKTGNVLVFREFNPRVRPGKERIIFARSVKGQEGQHFMGRAYKETNTFYVPSRLQLLKREIGEAISILS